MSDETEADVIDKPADDAAKADKAAKEQPETKDATVVEDRGGKPEAKDDATSEAQDWRDKLVAEVDESQRKKYRKSLEKFASEAAYGKSYLEMLKRYESRVEIPGEDADDETREAFAKAMGASKDPKDYKFERPDALTDLIEAGELKEDAVAESEAEMAEFAAAEGIPKAQAQAMYGKYLEVQMARRVALDEKALEERDTTQDALKEEYGKDYEANMSLASEFLKQYTGEGKELMQLRLDDGRLIGDVLPLVRMAVDAARNGMGEQGLAEATMDDGARTTIQDKIDEIFAEHDGKPSMNSDRIQTKLRGLYQKLYGTAPADGRVG